MVAAARGHLATLALVIKRCAAACGASAAESLAGMACNDATSARSPSDTLRTSGNMAPACGRMSPLGPRGSWATRRWCSGGTRPRCCRQHC